MDKQEFADQDFKERAVWVDIDYNAPLTATLKWSKTQVCTSVFMWYERESACA